MFKGTCNSVGIEGRAKPLMSPDDRVQYNVENSLVRVGSHGSIPSEKSGQSTELIKREVVHAVKDDDFGDLSFEMGSYTSTTEAAKKGQAEIKDRILTELAEGSQSDLLKLLWGLQPS